MSSRLIAVKPEEMLRCKLTSGEICSMWSARLSPTETFETLELAKRQRVDAGYSRNILSYGDHRSPRRW